MGPRLQPTRWNLSQPHIHQIQKFLVEPPSRDNVSQFSINTVENDWSRDCSLVMYQVVSLLPNVEDHNLNSKFPQQCSPPRRSRPNPGEKFRPRCERSRGWLTSSKHLPPNVLAEFTRQLGDLWFQHIFIYHEYLYNIINNFALFYLNIYDIISIN